MSEQSVEVVTLAGASLAEAALAPMPSKNSADATTTNSRFMNALQDGSRGLASCMWEASNRRFQNSFSMRQLSV